MIRRIESHVFRARVWVSDRVRAKENRSLSFNWIKYIIVITFFVHVDHERLDEGHVLCHNDIVSVSCTDRNPRRIWLI
jgi:hypothetical protein